MARANDRYWKIFPLQLLAIGFVAFVIVRSMLPAEVLRQRHRRFEVRFVFIGVFLLLLVLDYLVGIFVFDRWGLRVLQFLGRP